MKAKFLDSCNPHNGYLAFLPGHLLLNDDERKHLWSSPENRTAIREVRQHVSGRQIDARYALEWERSGGKMADLELGRVMLAYRINEPPSTVMLRQGVKKESEKSGSGYEYLSFMNDVIAMKIQNRLPCAEDDRITNDDIDCAMKHMTNEDGKKIVLGQIVSIQDNQTLEDWGKKKIKVRVATTSGWLNPRGSSLREKRQRREIGKQFPTLHHMRLALRHRLKEGDSGSIVYVMDKNDQCYLRLGMLHGVMSDVFDDDKHYIHIAIVLSQSIDEMKRQFKNVIGELELPGEPVTAVEDSREPVRLKAVCSTTSSQADQQTRQAHQGTNAAFNAGSHSPDQTPVPSSPVITPQTGVSHAELFRYISAPNAPKPSSSSAERLTCASANKNNHSASNNSAYANQHAAPGASFHPPRKPIASKQNQLLSPEDNLECMGAHAPQVRYQQKTSTVSLTTNSTGRIFATQKKEQTQSRSEVCTTDPPANSDLNHRQHATAAKLADSNPCIRNPADSGEDSADV